MYLSERLDLNLPASISQKLPSSNTSQNHPKLLHTLHVDKSSAVLSVGKSLLVPSKIFRGAETSEKERKEHAMLSSSS